MGVMDRFERRLDRMVNGVFARTFKSEVEPVEIAAALQRECDDRAAIVSRGRTMVPNAFTVELGPQTTSGCRSTPSRSLTSSPRWSASTRRSRATPSSGRSRSLRARRRPRHGAVPDPQRGEGGRERPARRPMTGAPPPVVARASRSTARPSRSTPTDDRHGSRRRRRPAHRRPRRLPPATRRSSSATEPWSTSARPTAPGSTTGRSPTARALRRLPGDRSAAPRYFRLGRSGRPVSDLSLVPDQDRLSGLLWVFVLIVAAVMRRDLFPRPPAVARGDRSGAGAAKNPSGKPASPRSPSAVATATLTVTAGALPGRRSSATHRSRSAAARTTPSCSTTTTRRTITPGCGRTTGGWLVEDLGSTNGTFLDKAKVTAPTPVPVGVPVRIGKTALELRK